MSEIIYAKMLDRVKAVLLDSLIITGLILLIINIFSQFDNPPTLLKIITITLIILLYDPFFTSTFGGTIGHFIIGLRVKKTNDISKKINLPIAIIRYIFKTFLGSISLLTVSSKNKYRAIHDNVAGSVVIKV